MFETWDMDPYSGSWIVLVLRRLFHCGVLIQVWDRPKMLNWIAWTCWFCSMLVHYFNYHCNFNCHCNFNISIHFSLISIHPLHPISSPSQFPIQNGILMNNTLDPPDPRSSDHAFPTPKPRPPLPVRWLWRSGVYVGPIFRWESLVGSLTTCCLPCLLITAMRAVRYDSIIWQL